MDGKNPAQKQSTEVPTERETDAPETAIAKVFLESQAKRNTHALQIRQDVEKKRKQKTEETPPEEKRKTNSRPKLTIEGPKPVTTETARFYEEVLRKNPDEATLEEAKPLGEALVLHVDPEALQELKSETERFPDTTQEIA